MKAQSAEHDPRAVANKIIQLAKGQDYTLTPMQVLKLTYFAHGWSFAFLNRGLFRANVEAWQYGPVIPEVYWAFKSAGSSTIKKLAHDEIGYPYESTFTAEEKNVLCAVISAYGKLHAYQMSD